MVYRLWPLKRLYLWYREAELFDELGEEWHLILSESNLGKTRIFTNVIWLAVLIWTSTAQFWIHLWRGGSLLHRWLVDSRSQGKISNCKNSRSNALLKMSICYLLLNSSDKSGCVNTETLYFKSLCTFVKKYKNRDDYRVVALKSTKCTFSTTDSTSVLNLKLLVNRSLRTSIWITTAYLLNATAKQI